MDLQVIVKESDVKYLRELIDKNAPVGYKSITDKEAEDLISENGNPNLAYGAYMENVPKRDGIVSVDETPTFAPESPPLPSGESPTYSPDSPTYSPDSPTYSPDSPTYSPDSPTYSPDSPIPGDQSPMYGEPDYVVDGEENEIDEDFDVKDRVGEDIFNLHEEGVSDSIARNEGLYKERIQEGETYLIVFKEKDELIDRLIKINNISGNKVDIIDEEQNTTVLFLDMDSNLILNSDEYDFEIIEFERLIEVDDINELKDDEIFIKQEFKTEIEIEVEETENKIYTVQEKKESFITELIYNFNAYNDDIKISQICELATNYINMVKDKKGTDIDETDILPFLKNGEKIPKWVIPIVKDIKKLYIEEEDGIEGNDDIQLLQLFEELNRKEQITNDEKNTYQTLSRSLNNFEPYENTETNVMVQHYGNYFRNCSDVNPCNGINKNYAVELNRTRGDLIIPLIKDGETVFETIRTLQTLPIIGLYLLPHKYIGTTIENNNILSIDELSVINELRNYMKSIRLSVRDDNIVHKTVGGDTMRNDIWTNNIHQFHLDDTTTSENFYNTLMNNFPTCNDIISSYPKGVMKQIFNYSDLRKLLLSYDIDYYSLNGEMKEEVNKMIKKNISDYILNYNKKTKRKAIKSKPKRVKILTTEDKIELSKEFIFSLFVVPLRNNYLEKFINKFSREPQEHEEYEYLYEKNSDKKLLCKHHLYNLKIKDDEDAFNSMKQIFGVPSTSGVITCKICGDFLCNDDFSLLEGFGGDNAPKNTREVLNTEEELKVLSEEQATIKKYIHRLSSLLNVELNEYDKQQIISFFDSLNNTELEDQRYSKENITKKHPKYKSIKEKYKKLFVYPESTQKIKKENKKYKKEYDLEVSNFQTYLENCNTVLVILFLILFHLQTSSPPYQIKTKELVYLWDNQTMMDSNVSFQNIHNNIRMETIDNLIIPLNKASSKYKKDKLFANINTFINESNTYKDLPNFKLQFIQTAKYILRNSNVNTKLREYINIKNDITNSIYLKEFWSSYKPLPDTKLIKSINGIINDQLKSTNVKGYLYKKGIDVYYENISSMSPMTEVYETPRYVKLKIPFTSILKNESYKRLFEYSAHLYGRSKENDQINILIKSFINTINDKNIENLLIKNGWDNVNHRLASIDYSKLKSIFFEEIIDYYKGKNSNDSDTIETFKYISVNNWTGMLLNGHSKRYYVNNNPIVIPLKNFNELLETPVIPEDDKEEKVTIIERLFKKYCADEDGNISDKSNSDTFISNLIDDPSFINRQSICGSALEINEENFMKILEYRKGETLLSEFKEIIIDTHFIEKRIHNFIIKNGYLDYPGDEAFTIFTGIDDITKRLDGNKLDKKTIEKEYRDLFNLVEDYKNTGIQKVKSFFKRAYNEKILTGDQISQYKKLWKSIDSLDIYIENHLDNENIIRNNISDLVNIIARLSNSNSEDVGTYFSDNIPKQWKLSDGNNEEIRNFMEKKEFLMHNDIFIELNKSEGFYRYEKDVQNKLCFRGLLSFITESYKGGINNLSGYDKSYYTTKYNSIFINFMFIFLFTKVIEYIEELYDDQSLISKQANEMFKLLQEDDEIKLSYSIEICTQLTFDILIHFLSENIDDGWIHQTDLISDKLSKQKEREKQNLINDLESKTADARAVTVEKQKHGIINWFAMSGVGNLDLLKTEKHSSQLDEDRENRIKELLMQHETEIEAVEAAGVDTDQLGQDMDIPDEIEQEGYSQNDQDREDEGLDDPDDDGDYREN
uniref:Uncharacterized protein n=1 Tax=viral metagenome TaxID=1070528 RepID=A0A6C0F3V2_9ZZZZ